jgi:signal transduction histidine kinase
VLLVVGMTTLVVLAFAVPIGLLIQPTLAQRAEHATVEQATNAAVYVQSQYPTNAQLATYLRSLSASTGRPTWVVCPDGTVLGTPPAGMQNLPGGGPGGGPPGGSHPGGDTDQERVLPAQLHQVPGGQVATATADTPSGTYVVQVFVSDDALHEGQATWWLLLVLGSVGLLLIGIGAAELLTRRIVRPLLRTAHTAQELSVGETGARAPTDGPREVAEVGIALNRLADRIDELIADERETVADLSHRLRTPLTALRLDAESLHDPTEAARVGAHVSSLERMLTAVIHAARRPQREGRMPSCDAAAVVADRVRFWSALADDQGRSASITLPDRAVPVRVAAEDLAVAVDALLENVIAHTAEGTAFAVRLTAADGGGARLEVSDDGPGFDDAAVLRGRSDRESTGLGLDIARRSAEASGGQLTTGRSPSGGALVTLVLRAP